MNPYHAAAAFRVPTVEAWNRRERPVTESVRSDAAPGLLERMRGTSSPRPRRLAGTPAA
jgi:hypothetical protein